MNNRGRNLISLKEARKILGSCVKNLTDEELEQLISDTQTLIRMILDMYMRSKNSRITA